MKRENRNSRIAREIHRPQAAREARKVTSQTLEEIDPREDGNWKEQGIWLAKASAAVRNFQSSPRKAAKLLQIS